jgi:flagellar basal body-associated protein FliL
MKNKSGLIQISVLRVVILHSIVTGYWHFGGGEKAVLYLQPHKSKHSSLIIIIIIIIIIFYKVQMKVPLFHVMHTYRGVEV